MSQKQFYADLKNLGKNNFANSEQFWKFLEQQDATQYVSQFCMALFDYVTRPRQLPDGHQDKMYATLLALQYYRNRSPKSEAIVARCKILEQNCHKKDQYQWILTIFRASRKEEGLFLNFISLLGSLPLTEQNKLERLQKAQSTLKYTKQLRKLKYFEKSGRIDSIGNLSIKSPFPLLSPISLSYLCSLDYIRSHENSIKNIQYQKIVQNLQQLLNIFRVDSQFSQQVSMMLHFIIYCITFYSCESEQIMKQLIVLADCARNCWGVIGDLATELFELLVKEIRVPGYGFRKKIRYDFPMIDMREGTFLSKQYYLVSQNEDSFSVPQDRCLINIRKQLIIHLQKISCIQPQKIQQLILYLRQMGPQSTYQLYFKSLKIIQISSQLQVFDQIKINTKNRMQQLLSTTLPISKSDNKKAQIMEIQQLDQLMRQDNALSIFHYPNYQIIYTHIDKFVSFNKKIIGSFANILNRKQMTELVFYRSRIGVVFYGLSVQFAKIVQTFTEFLLQAQLQDCKRLEVYYLPKPQSAYKTDVSSYIAAYDPWYNNFIYSIFKLQHIYPYLQLNSQTRQTFPSYLINKSIQMYLRSAKRVLYLRVYRCRLQIKQGEQITIYFTNGVSMGLWAEAQTIRQSKMKSNEKRDRYEKLNILQIIKDKIKKKGGYIGDIQITYNKQITKQAKIRKIPHMRFEDVQLLNLPHQNTFSASMPNNDVLRLTILSQNSSDILLKTLMDSDTFKNNKNQQEIYTGFKDLFFNYSVEKFSLHLKKESPLLKVFVDGTLYQKVQSVEIDVPETRCGLPLAIPILTFMPFW